METQETVHQLTWRWRRGNGQGKVADWVCKSEVQWVCLCRAGPVNPDVFSSYFHQGPDGGTGDNHTMGGQKYV